MKFLIYELYSIIVFMYLYFVVIEEKIFFPKKITRDISKSIKDQNQAENDNT